MSDIQIQPAQSVIRATQNLIVDYFGLGSLQTKSQLLTKVIVAQAGQAALNKIPIPNEIAAGMAVQNAIDKKSNPAPFNGTIPSITKDVPLSGKTSLGTPVWTNLVITAATYVDPVTKATINVPAWTFYSVLITLDFPKNIIKTETQGRNNSIKEYIGQRDAVINIKGGVFGLNGQRPKNDIAAIKAVFRNPNISIQVQAPIFDEWDITNIVVEDLSIPEDTGGYSYQLFEVKAVSDQDLVLNLSGL